jgi:hypothetical protein
MWCWEALNLQATWLTDHCLVCQLLHQVCCLHITGPTQCSGLEKISSSGMMPHQGSGSVCLVLWWHHCGRAWTADMHGHVLEMASLMGVGVWAGRGASMLAVVFISVTCCALVRSFNCWYLTLCQLLQSTCKWINFSGCSQDINVGQCGPVRKNCPLFQAAAVFVDMQWWFHCDDAYSSSAE